jgi:hypothetical protein
MKNLLVLISFCVLGAIIGGPTGFTIGLVIGVFIWIGSNRSLEETESPESKMAAQTFGPVMPTTGAPASLTEEQARRYLSGSANLYAWMFSYFGDDAPSKATELRRILERDAWLPDTGATLRHISAKMGQLRAERLQSPMQADLWIQGLIAQIKDQDEFILAHLVRHLLQIIPLAESSMPSEALLLLRSLHSRLQVQQVVIKDPGSVPSSDRIPTASIPHAFGPRSIPASAMQGRGTFATIPKSSGTPNYLTKTVVGTAGGILLADTVRASQKDVASQGSLGVSAIPPDSSDELLSEPANILLDHTESLIQTIEGEELSLDSEQFFQDNPPQESYAPADSIETNLDRGSDLSSAADSGPDISLD